MEVIWGEDWVKAVSFCCGEMSKLCLESLIDKKYYVMLSEGLKEYDCFLFNKETGGGMRMNFCPFCGEEIQQTEE